MRSGGLIVAVMLLAGCAAHDEKAELRKHCRQAGSETDMRCAKRTARPPPADAIEVCEVRIGSRRCYYVSPQELDRILREAQGQR